MGTYGRRNDEKWSERGRNGCRVRILTIGIMEKCSAWLSWEPSLVNCNDHLDSNGLSGGKVPISNHWLSSLSSFQGGICCFTLVSERKQIGSSAKKGCYRDWQEVIVRDEVPPLGWWPLAIYRSARHCTPCHKNWYGTAQGGKGLWSLLYFSASFLFNTNKWQRTITGRM